MPYKQFLGYEKDENTGLPMIAEKQAKIVRLIYKLFLEGKTYCAISKFLIKSNIPSPSGKKYGQQARSKAF